MAWRATTRTTVKSYSPFARGPAVTAVDGHGRGLLVVDGAHDSARGCTTRMDGAVVPAPARLASLQSSPFLSISSCKHSSTTNSNHWTRSGCRFFASTTDSKANDNNSSSSSNNNSQDDSVVEIQLRTPETGLEIPGAEKGGRKLAIVYTCNVCQTRSAKQFSEQAYRHGVVIVRCPGCQNQHLIADRLGYFQDDDNGEFDLQTIAQRTGQPVHTITDSEDSHDGVLELVLGTDKIEELRKVASEINNNNSSSSSSSSSSDDNKGQSS